MKKIIALVIAILMMAAIAVPAFASEVSTAGDTNVVVTYSTTGGYTVTIPDAITIGTPASVTVEAGALIASGTQLTVAIAPANDGTSWTLVDTTDDENTLDYTITKGEDEVAVDEVILTHAAGNVAENSVSLSFALADDVVKAGTYTQTITFTVAVGEAV